MKPEEIKEFEDMKKRLVEAKSEETECCKTNLHQIQNGLMQCRFCNRVYYFGKNLLGALALREVSIEQGE